MERLLDYQCGRYPITRQKLWLLSSVSGSKESVSVGRAVIHSAAARVHTCTFLVLDFALSVYTTPRTSHLAVETVGPARDGFSAVERNRTRGLEKR